MVGGVDISQTVAVENSTVELLPSSIPLIAVEVKGDVKAKVESATLPSSPPKMSTLAAPGSALLVGEVPVQGNEPTAEKVASSPKAEAKENDLPPIPVAISTDAVEEAPVESTEVAADNKLFV